MSGGIAISPDISKDEKQFIRKITPQPRKIISPEVIEVERMLSDRCWRLNNLYYVIDEDSNKVKFQFRPVQEQLYRDRWYWNVILKSRQHGITTFIALLFLDACLFEMNRVAGIVADTLPNAKKIFEKVQFAYDNLLPEIKKANPVSTDRKDEFVFARSNSNIYVSTSARTRTLSHLHVSELGKISLVDPIKAKEIVHGSIPTVHPGNVIFIESTADGGNEGPFYDICKRAEDKQLRGEKLTEIDFKFHFFPWYRDSKNRINPEGVLINDRMQSYFKMLSGKYEIELDNSQKAWYTISESTHLDQMRIQYPSCVSFDTVVQSDNGLVDIEKVNIDNNIIAKYDKGIRKIYELKTELGYRLHCTEDHLIKTIDGFKRLDNLSIKNDKILIGKFIFSSNLQEVKYNSIPLLETTIKIDEDFSRLIGYFMGDGCYYKNTLSISCTAKDKDVIEDVKKLIMKFISLDVQERFVGKNNGCVEIRVGCVKLKEPFKLMGLIKSGEHDGRLIRNICVPDFIKKSPQNVVKNFLKGIFESDGCSYNYRGKGSSAVTLDAKNEKFLIDIQLLLLGFGITSRLGRRTAINGEGRRYVQNRLSLRKKESQLFKTYIGFVSKRKNDTLNNGNTNTTYNEKNLDFSSSIKSIEYIREVQVYDITTCNNEFNANGIIVHNCSEEAFQSAIESAYYAEQFRKIRLDNRICSVPYQEGILVNTMWDLGMDDSMAIWFYQIVGRELHIIDCYDNNGYGFDHYKDILDKKGYRYGIHIAPHDISVREMGKGGMSRLDSAKEIGLYFRICPRSNNVMKDIDQVRNLLSICWFDESKCERGIKMLEGYRREWNKIREIFQDYPAKTEHRHYADAFRTGMIAHKLGMDEKMRKNINMPKKISNYRYI